MASLPESITALIATLGKLPGIGPRSAERLALHIVQSDATEVKQLAQTLVQAREKVPDVLDLRITDGSGGLFDLFG